MPEYLAPAVYVEETDTGSKPIEGVSTSTAGMLGVTERGPANVPILITGIAEFARWFGERLDPQAFSNGQGDQHCHLPSAVEGFFTNGGKRLYVSRVLDVPNAAKASATLYDRGPAAGSDPTVLLRAADQGTGNAASPLYVLEGANIAAGDTIRVGDGSLAEYGQAGAPAAGVEHIPLSLPLCFGHPQQSDPVATLARTPLANASGTLKDEATRGDTALILTNPVAANIAAFPTTARVLVEIGAPPLAEYRFARGTRLSPTEIRLALDGPVAIDQAQGVAISALDTSPGLIAAVSPMQTSLQAGDLVAFVANNGAYATGSLLLVGATISQHPEVRSVGQLSKLSISPVAYGDYPAGSVVEKVTLAAKAVSQPTTLTQEAQAGTRVIALDRQGIAVGDVLVVGAAPDIERARVESIIEPAPIGTAPDPGRVFLTRTLSASHPAGTAVNVQTLTVVQPGSTMTPVSATGDTIYVSEVAWNPNDWVSISVPDGHSYLHQVTPAAIQPVPQSVAFPAPLAHGHAAGSIVATKRAGLFDIEALDAGIWGNRIRVAVRDEEQGLVSGVKTLLAPASSKLQLTSANGVERGSVLEILDSQKQRVGSLLKVIAVDRSDGTVTVDTTSAPMSPQQLAAGLDVRSREFHLTVYLLRQPDPARPTRNIQTIAREDFAYLSMDPRHSRYIETIIGATDGTLRREDRRPEGDSWYIRVKDAATGAVLDTVRLGPDILIDMPSTGIPQPGRRALGDSATNRGDDSISTLDDDVYIGGDSVVPELRTGLFTLLNVDDIAIIGCPGRTGPKLQSALITHCENQRYRFAVLDSQGPPNDAMNDVQSQRQQFDTKYAALYYPWLMVDDPRPVAPGRPTEMAIPPSGHVLGVYARTDIERGVHKAPANEVVRGGVLRLSRTLNKSEQDLLNPSPVNINVIRDFRRDERGIRVWGGRVITSDTDWKYVNVRRLLIMIEKSIDRGLQWVVFEPNAEALWARVRRSISNFLVDVWRNGALEGTKPEEAFFVKCDRTTMTQTDIDNGRLICVIGVAPVKPAEFVIIRIGLWTAHATEG
jgi:hypothetical protein